MISDNLMIRYSDYTGYLEKYKSTLTKYKYSIDQYIDYLNFICKEAIPSGKVHDELVEFKNKFERISGMPDVLSSYLERIIDEYLTDLDNAQKVSGVSILYDWNYSGLRDYSPKYFNKLRMLAESVDYDSNWLFSVLDFIEDMFLGIAKFFGRYDNSKEDSITLTHYGLMQYNDVTKNQIDTIESKVREADKKCHNNLFLLKDLIDKLDQYIMLFYNTISGFQDSPKDIDLSGIDFDSKFLEMVNCYKDVRVIDKITDEEIEEFIYDINNERLIINNSEVITDYLDDILDNMDFDDLEFWNLFIFQMFNIGEDAIATRGEYKKLLMKNELLELMEVLAENYSYDSSKEHEIADWVKSFFSDLKKSGKSLYDFLNSNRGKDGKLILDGRTKEARYFRNFLKCLDNVDDILKYGDQGIEFISKLFIDYTKNEEFLDSFERNIELNDEMEECFKEIRALYEKEMSQFIDDAIVQNSESAIDLTYTFPIMRYVGIIKESIGLIGEVTGESAKTAAQTELMSYGYELVGSSKTALINSINKLREIDKNSDEYNQALSDFKNCFEIYKNSMQRLFNKMAISTDGIQRDYFYYCAEKYSTITIDNFSQLDIMSYEEYINQ